MGDEAKVEEQVRADLIDYLQRAGVHVLVNHGPDLLGQHGLAWRIYHCPTHMTLHRADTGALVVSIRFVALKSFKFEGLGAEYQSSN